MTIDEARALAASPGLSTPAEYMRACLVVLLAILDTAPKKAR